jgi:hypothetical protein
VGTGFTCSDSTLDTLRVSAVARLPSVVDSPPAKHSDGMLVVDISASPESIAAPEMNTEPTVNNQSRRLIQDQGKIFRPAVQIMKSVRLAYEHRLSHPG